MSGAVTAHEVARLQTRKNFAAALTLERLLDNKNNEPTEHRILSRHDASVETSHFLC
jgi:hypothetical protein